MKKKTNRARRGLSLLMALVMCAGLLQAPALAAEERELTCEKEVHEHVEECYKTEPTEELTCGQEESEEHSHTETCYGTQQVLICGIEEHSHTEECYATQESYAEEETAVCTCETRCTAENVDVNCPVCSAEGADLSVCEGKEPEIKPATCNCDIRCGEKSNENCPVCVENPAACMGEEPAVTESYTFDEETGTLTITGTKLLNQDIAKGYVKELGVKEAEVKALVLNKVEEVAGYAFYWSIWTGLEEVTVDGAVSIGDHAFWKSSALKTVTLINVDTIAGNAFSESKQLESVTMENIGFLGAEAFRQDSALTDLTMRNVKAFDRSPFSYCTGLTALTLDGSELGIDSLDGATMFYHCTGLTEVALKNFDTIGTQMFNGCTALETLTMENIGTISGQVAFGCTSLKSVTMGHVKTIDENAFLSSTSLETVTMDDIGTVGKNAFASCRGLKNVTMGGVDTIGQYAFQNCTGLETVTMAKVRFIDNYAFWNCSSLTSINSLSNVTERIGGFAFYGCSKLTGLTVADFTKMGYIGSNDELMERIQAILAGKFVLDNAKEIVPLTLEDGWAAGDIGQSENWNSYDNGTQLMEQARWQNSQAGVAEVKVDAYYTGKKQMDYIFVADLSASMAQLGNLEDGNARFYDMQSKLLDMTGQLLNTPGYDCKVAVITFGGEHQNNATHNSSGFMTSADEAEKYIKGLEPLNENTDYGLGMQEALELVREVKNNSDRNTVVVFLSDGAPNRNTSGDQYGMTAAAEIKELGVDIYGVLHSPTAGQHDNALKIMQDVCGDNTVYESTDTESFGRAMNAAVAAIYGKHEIVIPVNSGDFDVSSLNSTAGTVSYSDGVITWTINDMPFAQHTLVYNMTLKEELRDRVGTYTYRLGEGVAKFDNEGGASVTLGLNMTLSRTVDAPVHTLTIRYQYTNGTQAAATQIRSLSEGASYSVPSPAISSYRADRATVSGTMGTTDLVITVTYSYTGGGGGGGTGGGGGGGTGGGTTIDDGDVPLAGDLQLNREDHFAYIKGYQDGTVRPNNPLTRAQVATIFYRLLDEMSRTIYFQETNDFTDVNDSFWANKAISTLTNAGIITGFQDGTFRPNAYITRAQFAAIAARFDNVVEGLPNPFTDVAEDYWARHLIAYAADRGWITGQSGKFRPTENITRVEAMDFINNVLGRHVDEEGLLENAATWSDVPVTDPNYYVVEEATNTHDYERRTEGQLMENWTALLEDPVWDE